MRLVLVHARALTFELARYPSYVIPTLVFPSAFFLFFLVPETEAGATMRMPAWAGFAAIGVAFFQFGVGIAIERASPWEQYLRTLPVRVGVRLAARVVSAGLFAGAAATVLIVTALAVTDAALPAHRWVELALVLGAGMVPFALLGIALGYWAPERGALPIANLLYLGLSYAGGLWIPPQHLPGAVAALSASLPTGALREVLMASVDGDPLSSRAWGPLGAFSILFAALAVWGYRRDEGRSFR